MTIEEYVSEFRKEAVTFDPSLRKRIEDVLELSKDPKFLFLAMETVRKVDHLSPGFESALTNFFWGNCIAPGAIKNAGVSGQISEQNTTSRHMLARLIRAICKKVAFLT